MILSGQLLEVSSGTEVRIVQRRLSGYEVRTESGELESQSAWVVDNYVARIEN